MHKAWAQRQKGFTIVELITVIVVIGILASLTIVSYSKSEDTARAGAIANGLKTVAEAFRVWAIKENRTTWWDDNTITSQAGHPPVSLVIQETNLKYYLPSVPSVQGLDSASWVYDNDGDTYDGCSATSSGVNIYLVNFGNQAVAQKVDDQLDDGNLSCGKVRYDSSGRLLYSLDNSPTITQ